MSERLHGLPSPSNQTPGFSSRRLIENAWLSNPRGASQAGGAKSWHVRTGRNLRDHVRDLVFYRRKLRSSRLGAGSELEPVPVLFPQLHCLPGCVASRLWTEARLTHLRRVEAIPKLEPGCWLWMICSCRGWGVCLHCPQPFGTGPAWSALRGCSVPRPQKAGICLPQSSLDTFFKNVCLSFPPVVQFNSEFPFPPFFLVPFLEVYPFRWKWINKMHSYHSIFEGHWFLCNTLCFNSFERYFCAACLPALG